MSFTASLDEIVAKNSNGLLAAAPSWTRVRLGDVTTILNGFPFASSRFTKGRGVPLLRIRDVRRTTTEAFFDGEVDPQFLVEPGELVVGMDGDFNASLWHGPTAALNQRVCKITPDERCLDLRFLAYVLPGYLDAINAETSSITVKHLSSRTVSDIPVPLPPLAEQRRIVDALEEHLSDLDAAMAGLERARANIARYKDAVLDDAFTVSGEDPGSALWLGRTLGTATISAVIGLDRGRDKQNTGGRGVPYVKMADVTTDGRVLLDALVYVEASPEEMTRYALRDGDLLFNTRNSRELVGKTGLVKKPVAGTLYNNNLMRLRPAVDVIPQFLAFQMIARPFRTRLESVKRSTTNVAAIYAKDLLPLPIRLPPIEVQRDIVADVERRLTIADRTAAELGVQLARAARLRQAVLRRAFAGQLVPQDPADEPAAALLARVRAERGAAPARLGRHAGRGARS